MLVNGPDECPLCVCISLNFIYYHAYCNYNHYYTSYVFLSFILFIFKRCYVNQYIPDNIKGSKTTSTFHIYNDIRY